MTSGNRDAKKLARKLMLGEASWGKEPMPKTVNYTQALARANELISTQKAAKVVDETWHSVNSPEADELLARLLREERSRFEELSPELSETYAMTYRDINRVAREVERIDGSRHIEALSRVEHGLRNHMPKAHKELANAWESFLEHNVLDYKTLATRGEFGPWLKVRETRLPDHPEVTAIQIYIETLSGELHLSNFTKNREPALYNLPGDGMLRFVQKSEFGGLLEVSQPLASSTNHDVFSKRFAGMFDIVSKELDMDGKSKISDVMRANHRGGLVETKTWEQVHKKDLVRIGMYYGHGSTEGIGKGIYDASFDTYENNGFGKKIYVSRPDFDITSGHEPTLGELGSEDLIVWIPVGDGTYKHTLPVIAGNPREFSIQIVDLIMDVQEHGVAMAGKPSQGKNH